MSNILFHPAIPMVAAKRIAAAQGARLVYRRGRVRISHDAAAIGVDETEKAFALLDEARAMAREGRYEEALEKAAEARAALCGVEP